MSGSRVGLFVCVGAAVALWSGAVRANDAIDEAVARMDEADWDAALLAFDRAEHATDLTRAELAEVCVQRATLYTAIGDDEHARRDLAWLAAIDPSHVLGQAVPPPVHEAFGRARAEVPPLSVSVGAEHVEGEPTRVRVRTPGAPDGLVRMVRVSYRASDASGWSVATTRELELPAGQYDYYVELIGPGGVVLATEGTPDSPRHLGTSVPLAAAAATVAVPSGGDDTVFWVIGVAGGLAVVGLIVGLAVGLSTPSDQTAFGPPMLRMP